MTWIKESIIIYSFHQQKYYKCKWRQNAKQWLIFNWIYMAVWRVSDSSCDNVDDDRGRSIASVVELSQHHVRRVSETLSHKPSFNTTLSFSLLCHSLLGLHATFWMLFDIIAALHCYYHYDYNFLSFGFLIFRYEDGATILLVPYTSFAMIFNDYMKFLNFSTVTHCTLHIVTISTIYYYFIFFTEILQIFIWLDFFYFSAKHVILFYISCLSMLCKCIFLSGIFFSYCFHLFNK